MGGEGGGMLTQVHILGGFSVHILKSWGCNCVERHKVLNEVKHLQCGAIGPVWEV